MVSRADRRLSMLAATFDAQRVGVADGGRRGNAAALVVATRSTVGTAGARLPGSTGAGAALDDDRSRRDGRYTRRSMLGTTGTVCAAGARSAVCAPPSHPDIGRPTVSLRAVPSNGVGGRPHTLARTELR